MRVGIRTNEPEVLDRALESLPPGWRPASGPLVDVLYSIVVGGFQPRSNVRRFHLLYVDHLRSVRSLELEEVFQYLETDLQLRLAEEATTRSFVHAGAVGWNGRAVIIPGRTFCGKSTLVAEMVRAGATYYSDEFAVLDRQGRVHPYPLPLLIRDRQSEKAKKYSVEAIGGVLGVKPLPVALIVLSRYEPGAEWRPQSISRGQGVLALLANSLSARRQPEAALSTMQQTVHKAAILKGVRGEVQLAAESILNSLNN